MKITGPNRSDKAADTKKKKKTGSGDGSFGDLVSNQAGASPETQTTKTIHTVDSLLAVQETEDPTARAVRRRMHDRGDRILDELDKLRNALLTGTMTVGQVIDVANVVASHREKVMDPALTAILDEIDLRAQVEITKLRKAMDSRTA